MNCGIGVYLCTETLNRNEMLQIGDKAPNFTLLDAQGREVSLSDYAGKTVVVYFYPKDNTPGCTRQACAFGGHYQHYRRNDIQVIGISRDSVESHRKFAEKYKLPFVLLSDPEAEAIKAYGVWQEKRVRGKVTMGIIRSSFVINPDGTVRFAMWKVNPDINAVEILKMLGIV